MPSGCMAEVERVALESIAGDEKKGGGRRSVDESAVLIFKHKF